MKTILVCNNLLGDSLYLLKPVDLYLEKFPGECLGLCVLPQLGGDIVRKHFLGKLPIYNSVEEAQAVIGDAQVLYLSAGKAMEHCADFNKTTGRQAHISEGFAYMLGVNCQNDIKPPLDWLVKEVPVKRNRIAIIAPFSLSCSRHSTGVANKTLADWKWEHISRYLRRHEYTVQCIGGPKDLLQNCSLPISSYRSAKSLEDLQEILQSAELVISVDNGIGHLSSAFDVPTIILWSAYSAPPSFIAPVWASKTSYCMMGDPNKATPASLLYGIKELLPKVLV